MNYPNSPVPFLEHQRNSLRHSQDFSTATLPHFRQQAMHWAAGFSHACSLHANGFHHYPFGPFPDLLAAGCAAKVELHAGSVFDDLARFHARQPDWLFGFLGYDLKNECERLTSQNPDFQRFPDAAFFVPEHVLEFGEGSVRISTLQADPSNVFAAICQTPAEYKAKSTQKRIDFYPRFSREVYCQKVQQVLQHIAEGDVYELNLCMEFFAENVLIDPLATFRRLNHRSPNPFAAFYKADAQYLLCASPERFLQKKGNLLVSQPIKGTVRRGSTPEEDALLVQQLRESEKERAENMMIVDLVRNDLARSAEIGSIAVPEIFGIYSFAHLHQMISTVTARAKPGLSFAEIIAKAFPMGSMTGAPKIEAMKIIERLEASKRGIYSGALGYVSPTADFDFNVVIRSLVYNQQLERLSFQVGSAITYDAVAEQEYEECLLKAKAIQEVCGSLGAKSCG